MKYLRRFPYWYLLLVPILAIYLGAACNQAVFLANAGKFPVRMNAAWMDMKCSTKGMDPDEIADIPSSSCKVGGEMLDERHSIMGPNSNLKFLGDIFNLGNMYSVGDGLIYLGSWLQTFCPFMWIALALRKLYVNEDHPGDPCPTKV
jgi:Family of unknown function (DUF5317)